MEYSASHWRGAPVEPDPHEISEAAPRVQARLNARQNQHNCFSVTESGVPTVNSLVNVVAFVLRSFVCQQNPFGRTGIAGLGALWHWGFGPI